MMKMITHFFAHIPRYAVLCSAAIAALAVMPASAAADVLSFDVFRNGKPFGQHIVKRETQGETMVVSVDIDLEVRFGPFVPFRYRHDVREIWRDGALEALDSRTIRDGERLEVSARRSGERDLIVNGASVTEEAPGSIIPSTWWNREVLENSVILDSQTGELMPISVEFLGNEEVDAAGARVMTERYRVQNTVPLDLWYDEEGRWVKCAFDVDGQSIEYVLSDQAGAQKTGST